MYFLGGYMLSTNNLSYIKNFSKIILKIKDRKPNVIFGNGFSIDCLKKLKEVNIEQKKGVEQTKSSAFDFSTKVLTDTQKELFNKVNCENDWEAVLKEIDHLLKPIDFLSLFDTTEHYSKLKSTIESEGKAIMNHIYKLKI